MGTRAEVNLLEIVSEYTSLIRRGNEWAGLCPFHEEKTPSFFVNPDKGFYHCYGCSRGGDLISFLREKRGLSYPEAARLSGKEVISRDKQPDMTKVEAREQILAQFHQWEQSRIDQITELREEIEIAEIAFWSTTRAPEVWTEDECNYWREYLNDLYNQYEITLEENLTFAVDEEAAWKEWRSEQEGNE